MVNQNIFILIGSNLGNRLEHLRKSAALIEENIGRIEKESSVYETAAWGKTDEPNYLNQVLKIKSLLSPIELLQNCLSIEKSMGRIRKEKWEARTIDIDILYYKDTVINLHELIIPHPRLHERKFVLVPLVEIDEAFVHPVFKKSNKQLLEECTDQLSVNHFKD